MNVWMLNIRLTKSRYMCHISHTCVSAYNIVKQFLPGITQSKLDKNSDNQECKNPEINSLPRTDQGHTTRENIKVENPHISLEPVDKAPTNSDNIKENNAHNSVGNSNKTPTSSSSTKVNNPHPLMVPTDTQKENHSQKTENPASTDTSSGIT